MPAHAGIATGARSRHPLPRLARRGAILASLGLLGSCIVVIVPGHDEGEPGGAVEIVEIEEQVPDSVTEPTWDEPVELVEVAETEEPAAPTEDLTTAEYRELESAAKVRSPERGPAVRLALAWLAAHQDEDGRFDADEFMKHDPPGDRCDGAGNPTHDVGVTGLALLAFLGDGQTTAVGPNRGAVKAALQWLREQQDPDTGLIGSQESHAFMYDHAIATLAMCEAHRLDPNPLVERSARLAANHLMRARNPYAAWRYDVPPTGDNDTSVTGWAVRALLSAQEGGIPVDTAAFDGALSFIDQVTDPATGRTGYDSFGSLSSRTPANEHYPRESGEAMTAVGLLCRIGLGRTPEEDPIMAKNAALIRRKPPEWDPEGLTCDMYYWYHGSHALARMGERYRVPWDASLLPAVLDSQKVEGSARGSWDPIGPWGYAGGRVYATALLALALEAGHVR